jgi:hypothetical protein
MEVGAPNSEPGSNRDTTVGGSRGMTQVFDQISAGLTVVNGPSRALRGFGVGVPAVWLSGLARESRGMRPGLM